MADHTPAPSMRELRTRAGLTWIADRLTTEQPDEPMTGEAAKMAARLYALEHADSAVANGVMWDLRRALPEVRRTDTRDTYAARLRLLVEGVTA
ncbi:hypothetical protein ACFVZH_22520 [Streptomyces sp. NPDC059534]|uniref:hypothetical protein n=1 Tax=Streptomyces sp. NPDC059534 TaxID=3346859 RepID=UPI0036A41818